MHRSILTPLAAGEILLAFAALPPMLPGSTTMSLSGSALAETASERSINLNTSRSNVNRADPGKKPSTKRTKSVHDRFDSRRRDRMGRRWRWHGERYYQVAIANGAASVASSPGYASLHPGLRLLERPSLLQPSVTIFSRAALAMKAERVSPRAPAASSIASSSPASRDRLALAGRP